MTCVCEKWDLPKLGTSLNFYCAWQGLLDLQTNVQQIRFPYIPKCPKKTNWRTHAVPPPPPGLEVTSHIHVHQTQNSPNVTLHTAIRKILQFISHLINVHPVSNWSYNSILWYRNRFAFALSANESFRFNSGNISRVGSGKVTVQNKSKHNISHIISYVTNADREA